ncbi:hypothetical protein ATCC90586_009192 [Pythium insidiosum]|nr:hypothetical protein ATCC90586_009192 [Pythium insidiosum]
MSAPMKRVETLGKRKKSIDAEDVKTIDKKDEFNPNMYYVSLTSHAEQFGVEPVRLRWGQKEPEVRGPVIGTNRYHKYRNAIGAHGGSYCVYRGLAIVTIDPFGHCVLEAFPEHFEKGYDIRPTIAVTKAHMDLPEIHDAIRNGRLKPDGKILKESGQLVITKAAIDPVWYLPGVAKRFNTTESNLRQMIFQETNGMYPELVTRTDLKVFLPPIGGVSIYIFGKVESISDPSKKLAVRVHDECNGSDVFGSDICTCRPYLTHAIEVCVETAQQGGAGVIVYFRKEGRALGEVTKYLVYNLRKRQEGGDRAEEYFNCTQAVAGIQDVRFQALMPDALHWLGITKIDRFVSMSDMKYDAIVKSGIKIIERIPIPEELVPKDAKVEITAKVFAGYNGGNVFKVDQETLKKVKGRGDEEYEHEVIIEKHWRGLTSRNVCDFFMEEVNKYREREDVPPIIVTSKYYLVSVFRDDLFLLAVVTNEIAPLFVIEFLHRVLAVFRDYFGTFDENSMKDNFSTVYQLLEEMLDNGYPLTTEPNALKAMVAPPSTANRIAAMVSGKSRVSNTLPDGALSNIPWRKSGVKYTQNEIYFDIIEEIDAILDTNGHFISCEVTGVIHSNSRLSGVPDLTMVFTDPSVIDDCSFHPCVRYSRYERERVISFVPPDGQFELMQYRVQVQQLIPPVFCHPQVTYNEKTGTGSLELQIVTRGMPTLASNSKKSLQVEDISVDVTFPKSVRTVDANTEHGTCIFDESSKTVKWNVGKMNNKKGTMPSLRGNIILHQNAGVPDEKPIVLLDFKVPMSTVSGLNVETLLLTNEKYKPYKGVRTLTKAGRFQIRM